MIFEGVKRLAVEYRDLTESRLGPDGFHVAVDSRNYLFTGPSEQLEINLIGAQAMTRGVDPIVLAIDAHREATKKLANVKKELAWLERELARTARPRRPRSPGWVLGTVFLVASLGFVGPGRFTDPVAAASTSPGASGVAVAPIGSISGN
jgi:hypothetical protein